MHLQIPILASLLLTPLASAHYRFQKLTAAGTTFPDWQYIRQSTQHNSPVTDLSSPDLRCNFGGLDGASVGTVSVAAGSTVGFALDQAVYHQGPVMWYLGKAPGAAKDWDGSGQSWIKFKQEGPTFSGGGASWPMRQSYTAQLPANIPTGEYLLRIEQIALHNPGAAPQFYISCAQISVKGGSGSLSGFAIPGHIKSNDPGITVNIYNQFSSYTFPGPVLYRRK